MIPFIFSLFNHSSDAVSEGQFLLITNTIFMAVIKGVWMAKTICPKTMTSQKNAPVSVVDY